MASGGTVPMSQIDRDGLYRPSAAGQLDPVHLAPHAAEREQYVAASTDRRTVDGLALWSPAQQNSGLTKSDVPAMGSPCSQQQRLLRTVPVHSPRVMQTRPAEDRGRSPPPPEMEDARYRVQRSFGERESERPDLSLGLWDKMVTVRGGPTRLEMGHTSTPRGAVSPRAQSPVPRQGQIAKGGSTIGVSVYGTQIDYVVPGGPAHLSQKLEKGDEILSVDSVNVDFGNVVQCLQGNDTIGSRVKLRVRKSATGQEVQVDLVRVDKGSMENLVKIFQKLTLLKQNGHNNEGFESSNYPPGQDLTMTLVDQLVSLISMVQIEKHNSDIVLKKQFTKLYDDLRTSLAQAYDEIDFLRSAGNPDVDYKSQCESLRAEVEKLRSNTEIHVRNISQAQRIALPSPSEKLYKDTERELEAKKNELAKELEIGMQRDFEIRKLSAQSEVLMKELETAKRATAANDREIQQRSLEDKELERKLHAFQDVLNQSLAEAAEYKDLSDRLKTQLSEAGDENSKKDRMRSEASAMLEHARSDIRELEQQVRSGEAALKKMNDENQTELRQSDMRQRRAAEENQALRERLRELEHELAEVTASMQQHSGFRAGDICEATVISAHNLPGTEDTSTSVMLALDARHQVQQTHRVTGLHPKFDEDFVAKLSKDTKFVTFDIYQSRSDDPGELVGHCYVRISEIDFAPGREVEVVIVTDEDQDSPLMVNGKQSTMKLFLARSNPKRSGRTADDDAMFDPAEMRRLQNELAAARAHIGKLEAHLLSAKEAAGAAESLRQQLLKAERDLDEAGRAREILEDDLKKELDELRSEYERTLRLRQSQAQQTNADLQQAEARSTGLKDENKLLEAELDKLRGTLAVKEQVVSDLHGELVEARSSIEGLSRKVKSSEDEIAVERREIEADEEKIARLERQVIQLQRESLGACKACDEKNAHMAELASKLQKMMHELARMEAESKTSKEEAASARRTSEVFHQEKSALLDQVQGLEEENRVLKEELKRRMNDLEALTAALTSERDDLLAMKTRLNAASDTVSDRLKAENTDLQRINLRLRQEVDLARAAIEEARKVEAQSSLLHQQLAEVQSKLDLTEAELARLQRAQDSSQRDDEGDMPFFMKARGAPQRAQRSAAPPPQPGVPNGKIGMKIADVPPHKVLSVTELMNKDGKKINEQVQVNDELCEIDGVHVEAMPVQEVLQRVAGPPGTLVVMNFKDHRSDQHYDVIALRHLPQSTGTPMLQMPEIRPLSITSYPEVPSLGRASPAHNQTRTEYI